MTTSPRALNLEDSIQEDCFDIRFIVQEYGESPQAISVFEIFESPLIIPCRKILQDVSEFLRSTASSYLSERATQTLASEIAAYYQQIVQHSTVETASSYRLIPLEVRFYMDYAFGFYTPISYVLQSYQDHRELTETNEAIDQSMQQLSLVPASKEAIASLKKMKMRKGEINACLCSICLEDFDDDVDLSATPCGHIYHSTCIVKWLETSHLCPLCRYQML